MTDKTDEFLAHFGVKGMKWGRRKADSVPDGTVKLTAKSGKKITAVGGKNIDPHVDAINAATSRQKAKASTTDALSTKELQDLVTRMNLEQQYAKLSAGQISPGKKFVNDLLTNAAKQQANKYVNDQVNSYVSNKLKK